MVQMCYMLGRSHAAVLSRRRALRRKGLLRVSARAAAWLARRATISARLAYMPAGPFAAPHREPRRGRETGCTAKANRLRRTATGRRMTRNLGCEPSTTWPRIRLRRRPRQGRERRPELHWGKKKARPALLTWTGFPMDPNGPHHNRHPEFYTTPTTALGAHAAVSCPPRTVVTKPHLPHAKRRKPSRANNPPRMLTGPKVPLPQPTTAKAPRRQVDPTREGLFFMSSTTTTATTTEGHTVHLPQLAEDADCLTAALAYAAAGIYVLPVKRGTKHPGSRVGDRWQDKSSRDPQVIASWFSGTTDGIAFDLGRSGLIVIDVDYPELLPPWLQTALTESGAPYQSTRPDAAGRGHYVFRQPEGRHIGCGKGQLSGMGLDVKGAGGVIIVEPTHHPDGGEYRWITTGPVPVAPAVIADKLPDAGERKSAATDGEVQAFLDRHATVDKPQLLDVVVGRFTETRARNKDSRHDAMVELLPWALRDAVCGFYPARAASEQLRKLFVSAYGGEGDRQSSEAADSEFDGILAWAVGQVSDEDPTTLRDEADKRLAANAAARNDFSGIWTPREDEDAAAGGPGAEAGVAQSGGNEENPWAVIDGAGFILDQPKDIPAIWGEGDEILWAEGEALMIAGGQGLGKTTLAGLLLRGLLGLDTHVLGLPVNGSGETILYLAMDRPRQIARSLARQFTAEERAILKARVIFRPGPPMADLAQDDQLLLRMARGLGAGVVVVDSVKDAAVGLSEDAVGAGYNRARQRLLADGQNMVDLHHIKKAIDGTPTINDIYGSTWLTSGCGSVILLTGAPGDPIVGFHHLKQPAEAYGPFKLSHDNDRGRLRIWHSVDALEVLRAAGADGLTAKQAAAALFNIEKPTDADAERARRKLDALRDANPAQVVRRDGKRGKAQTTWSTY